MEAEKEIVRFFDCCETPARRKSNTKLSRKARAALLKGLEKHGIQGRTVLEIGCGPGDLTRALIKAGADRAVGIDLTSKTLEEARRNAEDEGLSDKIEFRTGNGATDELPRSQIVVLDKVICCYPDWRQLVDNTSSASTGTYGFVIPRSDSWHRPVARFFIGIEVFFLRLRKCGFQAFVHDYNSIHEHLSSKGFSRTHLELGPIWMATVYARS